jgi:hypothetical protein
MVASSPLVDADSARTFLRSVVPEWEWLIAHIESERGHLRFPSAMSNTIRNLKIENYPLLYEREASIGLIVARALLDEEEIESLEREAKAATPEERGSFICDMAESWGELDVAFEIPKTPAAERRAREAFEALSPEERSAAVGMWQRLMMGFLASFYQHLSVMVHGEKLTALVAQAKGGDSTAFAKAVQIDRRILTTIPYFKERYERAGMESDADFLEEVGRRLTAPPYRGKIRHKSLWLTFAILEACGLLAGFEHAKLLDFCDEVGVGRHKNRIDDVKNLSKRLAEYRRFQGRASVVPSTP